MRTEGLSRQEIVELTGAVTLVGEAEARITRVSAIAAADGQALVFAGDTASLETASRSGAGLILTATGMAVPGDNRVLPVRDPRYAFAVVARELARRQEGHRGHEGSEAARIHASAWVDGTAVLGQGVWVGAGAVIEAGAVLGDDVRIESHAVVAEGVVLGNRVVVQAGAVLGARGFGYVRDPETGEYLLFPQQGGLVIEDDVEIGANSTIDRGALEETRIGRGTKIDNLVHIGHNCRIGRNVVIAAQAGVSGSCVIEDGAILAGQVGLSDHCHIGPGVILGGQAGVYRGKAVVGPGEVFAGTPAEPLRDQMRGLARLRALAKRRR